MHTEACSTPEVSDDKIFGILNTYKKKREALNLRWTATGASYVHVFESIYGYYERSIQLIASMPSSNIDNKGLRKESGGRMRSMSQ